jgi:hypothetical protein
LQYERTYGGRVKFIRDFERSSRVRDPTTRAARIKIFGGGPIRLLAVRRPPWDGCVETAVLRKKFVPAWVSGGTTETANRPVGQPGEDPRGFVYGAAFVDEDHDFWELKFPRRRFGMSIWNRRSVQVVYGL